MSMLTQQERDKFVLWLERDADSNEMLIEQMNKIPSPPIEALIKQKRAEAMACRVVARMLKGMEFQAIQEQSQ